MNFAEILAAGEEAIAIYNQLKADGTLAKLQAAEQELLTLYKNPDVQKLFGKLAALVPHVAASAASTVTTTTVAK